MDSEPSKKIFCITEKGKISLYAAIKDWNNICNIVNGTNIKWITSHESGSYA